MAAFLKLCGVFLKIGVIFFGGGYVLIPLLHRIMVDQLHWLSLKEFLDGVALSQLTPGPLAMLATFTGYKAAGFAGALAATGRSRCTAASQSVLTRSQPTPHAVQTTNPIAAIRLPFLTASV